MAVPTGSSNGRRGRNDRARFAVLFGLLALAAGPVGIEAARVWKWLSLTHSVAAIAVASTLLGIVSIRFARGATRDAELTLGRVGGSRTTHVGRLLGLLGVFLGLSAACALGFYGLLLAFGSN